jgi:hypothetical protein
MDPLEQRIRHRAYQLWEQEGRPHGREHEHWQRARSEVMAAQHGEPTPAQKSSKKAARKASDSAAKSKRPKASNKTPEDQPRL